MNIGQDIIDFNNRLAPIVVIVKEIYKIKTVFNLTVGNCVFKDEKIVITHPDIPTITFLECDLDSVDKIKNSILSHIKDEATKKKLYDLKWSVDYWMGQTNPEFIARKLKDIENWQKEIATLEGK